MTPRERLLSAALLAVWQSASAALEDGEGAPQDALEEVAELAAEALADLPIAFTTTAVA